MDNKDRIISFIKGFGSVALTLITLVACAGSLNFGVELGRHGYTIMGTIGMAWSAYLIYKAFKNNNIIQY